MFASQLLKILQAIPSDVKYESCVFDPDDQNMTMKENQNATIYDSKSFGAETNPLNLESKEIYQSNDSRRDSGLAFEVKGRDEILNPKVVDDFSMDNENGTIDSPRKEDLNGLLHDLSGWEKKADSLSSGMYDNDKEQRSPQDICPVTVEEFTNCEGNESRDSSSPFNGDSHLFETDTNLFTDKNVLECELPELEVCCREINVKDICVDEGMPEKDKILIGSCKDDQSEHLFPQPANGNNHCEATEGDVETEIFRSDGIESSSFENTNGINVDQCGSKEENNGKFIAEGRLKLPSDSSFDQDTAKHCDPEDSLVDRKLPIEEFGTRSFLRSFLNTLDGEGDKVMQPPDQIPNGKSVSEISATSSAEAGGPKEDAQASSLLYNSDVESRSITFNFNSPVPVVAGITNEKSENVKEQSVDSGDVHDHKDANTDNLSDARQVQCTSSKDSIGNVHEQSHDSSATSQVQCVSSDSDDLSADSQVQFSSNKSTSSTHNDEQAVEPHNVSKHERKNSANVSVVNQLQHDEGEASFSAAGLITYSGPIAFSGSLSHRSDSSATSGKSFAFPVLQTDWNSSPVRMAKADRRHFRKHKGWRSGLLCCRF